MWIIATIIIGFVVGLLARFLLPGNDRGGFIFTTLLGIGGAFMGTFLGQQVGWLQQGETTGFLGALGGALIVLVILRMAR